MKVAAGELALAADDEWRAKEAWDRAREKLDQAKDRFSLVRKRVPGEALPRGLLEKAYYSSGWLIKIDSVGQVKHMERTLAL